MLTKRVKDGRDSCADATLSISRKKMVPYTQKDIINPVYGVEY